MIYLHLMGGLGNQFFQYAYAKNLQKMTGDKVTYLTYSYKKDALRDVALNRFRIDSTWVEDDKTSFWKKHPNKYISYKLYCIYERLANKSMSDNDITENYRAKQEYLFKKGLYLHDTSAYVLPLDYGVKDKYVEGMWHHTMYFDKFKSELQQELHLIDTTDVPKALLEEIIETNSVCVHIRRGDYLNYAYYMTCDINYYLRAIKCMKNLDNTCRFYFFSDDIQWVMENLTCVDNCCFVQKKYPDYVDFELMRSCKHFIISNSTFSWWAAYLGQYPKKKVITPDKWYTDGRNKEWLNLDGWIELETRF